MNDHWRVLPWTIQPADYHLAAGEAMLAGLATTNQPAVRWYGARSPALIIGKGQSPEHVDSAACHDAGVPLHRRSSGGTAVLMTRDLLMLDVALPKTHRLYTFDVTQSYRWFGEIWETVLHTLRVAARLIMVDEARADTRTLDQLTRRVCFGGISPYEVAVDTRKIVGLAQIRRRYGILLQAGIYIHWEPYRLVRLLNLEPAERVHLEHTLLARTTGLMEHRHTPTESAESLTNQVMEAFVHALTAHQQVSLENADWLPSEQAALDEARPGYAAIA